MGKTLAYIRVSDDKQDIKNQRHEILEASRLKDIKIDDFISFFSGTHLSLQMLARCVI